MTHSNLDLARECGASGTWTSDFYKHSIVFSMKQLDAFAERIRAEALASAPAQPVAVPAGMPEPAAWRIRYRSEPGMLGHYPWTYTDRKPRWQNDTAHEVEPVFTAAQVQAMLAAHVPVAAFDRLQSLADSQAAQLLAFDDALEPPVARPSPAAVEHPDLLSAVTLEIWNRFASDHRATFAEESHKAEYRFAAEAVIALVRKDDSDYAAPQPLPQERKPLTYEQIREWWSSENGLEDCDMAKLTEFADVVRAVEEKHGITAQ